MRLKFFTVPVFGDRQAADELDRFLAAHRIMAIDKELIHDGRGSVWSLCVSYDHAGERQPAEKRSKVDYKEILSETEFPLYARLRELRKRLADAEGVPAYALFTNEQLAAMVQKKVTSAAALRDLPGVGAARVEKYAESFLAVLREGLAGSAGGGSAA